MHLMFYNVLLRQLSRRSEHLSKGSSSSSPITVQTLTAFASPIYKRLGLSTGDVFREVGKPFIYFLESSGKRRPFNTWDNFIGYGYNIHQVKSFVTEDIQQIPLGEPLPPP